MATVVHVMNYYPESLKPDWVAGANLRRWVSLTEKILTLFAYTVTDKPSILQCGPGIQLLN